MVAVVFWSASGNTEAMADAVVAGAKDAEKIQVSDFSADMVDNYDAIAFGCPAMGDEELEDSEFLPVWEEVSAKLSGKKVGLFGSYDWGDGEWMRLWAAQAKELGADLVNDGVIANLEPDDEAVAACEALGAALAG